jgi:hypothetical protein
MLVVGAILCAVAVLYRWMGFSDTAKGLGR